MPDRREAAGANQLRDGRRSEKGKPGEQGREDREPATLWGSWGGLRMGLALALDDVRLRARVWTWFGLSSQRPSCFALWWHSGPVCPAPWGRLLLAVRLPAAQEEGIRKHETLALSSTGVRPSMYTGTGSRWSRRRVGRIPRSTTAPGGDGAPFSSSAGLSQRMLSAPQGAQHPSACRRPRRPAGTRHARERRRGRGGRWTGTAPPQPPQAGPRRHVGARRQRLCAHHGLGGG